MSITPTQALDLEGRLDEVIADYLKAVEAGQVPDRQALLAEHPELAEELASFFTDEDRFGCLAGPLRTVAAPNPNPGPAIGNYDLLEEIGRGGMGIIYKARQRHVNRIVALKMLRAGETASPADLQRFQTETEAVANLDHPHIVPIYEVGEESGQRYFSMKLMEGGSLAAPLDDFRLHDASNSSDSDQTTNVPSAAAIRARQAEIAGLVATVAQAVHYAHQRGILHRDLKPANILLDEQRRPHVTDFGLAKKVAIGPWPGAGSDATPCLKAGATNGQPLPALPQTAVRRATDTAHSVTQSGAIIGTPNYMAPEQATGQKGSASTASDIYSLGVILYELLIGRPPFRTPSALETLLQLLEQDPERPRTLNPRIDRDLETICLRCLEKAPGARYPSAAALAEDLERFLAGEPILARRVGPFERGWRWCRRNPGLAMASVLALVALAAVTVGAILFALSEARHVERLNLAQAELLQQQEQKQHALEEAQRQRDQADASFHLAHRAVGDFAIRMGEERLAQFPGLQPVRKELLAAALQYYQDFLKQRGHDPALQAGLADTHFRIAVITSVIGSREEALKSYAQAAAIYRKLLRSDPGNAEYQSGLARTQTNRGALQDGSTQSKQAALASYKEASDLLKSILGNNPRDNRARSSLAITYTNMGNIYRAIGQLTEARAAYDRAQEQLGLLLCKQPESAQYQKELAILHANVGVLQGSTGQDEAALASYEKARDIQEKLVRAQPRNLDYQHDLALSHHRIGLRLSLMKRRDEALVSLKRGRLIFEKLTHDNPLVTEYWSDLAASHRVIGETHRFKRAPREALASYEQARTILTKLTKDHPTVTPFLDELSGTYFDMGLLLAEDGQRDNAIHLYGQAREIQAKLVQADPHNLDGHHSLGKILGNLGLVLSEGGRGPEAEAVLRQAAAEERLAICGAPKVFGYRDSFLRHHRNLANTLQKAGKAGEAVRTCQEMCALMEELSRSHPQEPALQADLARAYVTLAEVQRSSDQAAALDSFRRARAAWARLIEANPENLGYRYESGRTLNLLGWTLASAGRYDEAVASLQEAIEQQQQAFRKAPQVEDYRRSLNKQYGALGEILRKAGRPAEAIAATRARLKLWPGNPQELYIIAREIALAAALVSKGKATPSPQEQAEVQRYGDFAMDALQQAVASGFKDQARLEKDSALDVFRSRADFRKLLVSLKQQNGSDHSH